ncbi:hypothetical protein AA0N74_01615 [Chromobacterium vaccinii]|uniref:hypothetical protein n=1 Tax=Chromobacterium vaccinii TaxID=1108595 RepID=UPI0031CE6530
MARFNFLTCADAIKNYIKSIVSGVGHLILFTCPKHHITLLKVLIASSFWGLLFACFAIFSKDSGGDGKRMFFEILTFVLGVISVLEIADGVVLSESERSTLKKGGQAAAKLIPELLVNASQKCKVGLVFIMYSWVIEMAIKYNFL